MAFKYISIHGIIEDIYRSEGYTHELDWMDAIEWTGKALRLIGAPDLYVDKVTGNSQVTPHVSIKTYKGELPVDFVDMLPGGVRDNSTKEVYHYSTDSFAKMPANSGDSPHNTAGIKRYTLNDNYIFTDQEEATLQLAYRAVKIDGKGFPMVPDIERVIEAVRSFITFRIDHKLWRQNKVSKDVRDISEQDWLWYVGSANTALRIRSVDKRHAWSKAATRLLPMIHDHSYSYSSAGIREDLNIGSE